MRGFFAANIESQKKEENFQIPFCGKKEYFQNSTHKNKKIADFNLQKKYKFSNSWSGKKIIM